MAAMAKLWKEKTLLLEQTNKRIQNPLGMSCSLSEGDCWAKVYSHHAMQLNMFGNFANSFLQTLRYAHNIGPYDIYEIWNLFLILCHFNFAHTTRTVHAYILFLISPASAREKSHWPLRPKTHHKQRSLPILKSNPLAISVQKLKKKEWEFFHRNFTRQEYWINSFCFEFRAVYMLAACCSSLRYKE